MPSSISPKWNKGLDISSAKSAYTSDFNSQNIKIRSSLLSRLFPEEINSKKLTIVDTNKLSPVSLKFFNNYWCKLIVTDISSDIANINLITSNLDDEENVQKSIQKVIDSFIFSDDNIDIILLWDLLNYLTLEQIQSIFKNISRCGNGDKYIHAYFYDSGKMPSKPLSYRISSSNEIMVLAEENSYIDCPLYHRAAIQKHSLPFEIDSTVMLPSGMQEYLFYLG